MDSLKTAGLSDEVREALREIYGTGGMVPFVLAPEVKGAIRELFGVTPQGLKE
ncbi:MAG: hypothetical protein H3C30_19535 [Candidatus Hydrogenedentes bacterium]|nr:hypothetical protein [Candidatus Hydrogenedentota bacterium]